jgi:hypothetical protein
MDVCLRVFLVLTLVAVASEAQASPRKPADDCLARLSPRECHDEDGVCDLQPGPGCLLRSSICFNTGAGEDGCSHRGIDGVRIVRPYPGGARGGTARSLVDALVALGGEEGRRSVSFDDEPMTTCRSFLVSVPRKGKRSGRTLVATKTTADGSTDADRARFVCLPSDPESESPPPLSSGCRFEMDRTECEARNGVFAEAAGILQLPHCFCRTDDVGETCDHNPQCQGLCVTEDIDATSGNCSEFKTTFDCVRMFLAKGRAFQICID